MRYKTGFLRNSLYYNKHIILLFYDIIYKVRRDYPDGLEAKSVHSYRQ